MASFLFCQMQNIRFSGAKRVWSLIVRVFHDEAMLFTSQRHRELRALCHPFAIQRKKWN